MQGVKISWIGRSFEAVASLHSSGHRKYGRRKTKEERRTTIESFVQKYRTLNEGKFPSLSLTQKEVGGSFYIVRQIMHEIIEEHKLFDTLGTDLEAEKERHTTRHVVEPLSVPAEVCVPISSAIDGNAESIHVLELKDEKYQENLLCTEDQKNILDNYVREGCGSNDQKTVEREIQMAGGLSETAILSQLVNMQPLQAVTDRLSCEKEEQNAYKSMNSAEHLRNENIHEPVTMPCTEETKIVVNESMMGSCSSLLENQSDYEFSELQAEEFHFTHFKEMSASTTLSEDTPISDMLSVRRLDPNPPKNQNLLGVDVPVFPDNELFSVSKKMAVSYSPSAENFSYLRSYEADEKHFPLSTPASVYPVPDSHFIACAIDLPMDLPHSANYEEKAQLSNSRKEMLKEPKMPADSVSSLSRTNVQTNAGQTAETRADILKGRQLTSLNVDQEQMLLGVQAFYRTFLHRLALSALIIQTWVHAADAYQTVSSEVQHESLGNLSLSNHGGDSNYKTPSVLLSSVPDQVQSEIIGNERRSTLKSCNDGNHTEVSEDTNNAFASTKSFEGTQKLESKRVWDNLKAIAIRVFSFWKD